MSSNNSSSRAALTDLTGRSQRTEPATSPCIGRCCLDASGVCVGCCRTSQEIAIWSSSDDSRKQSIIDSAAQRRAARLGEASDQEPRRGFTLVELLVVIAVIGILIGLLLPAVQAVREAARKTSCKNNLHQIGIGLHAYHNLHRSLPTGCVEWRSFMAPPTHRQFAWSAFLLPFLEEQNLHQEIDFSLPFDAPENAEAAAKRVATYECPSFEYQYQTRGGIDYGGLFGERIIDTEPDDGVFLYEKPIRFRDITDGLTNTMAVAEDVGGPDAEWINGRNVFVQAYGINDSLAWIGDNEIRSVHGGGAMVLFVDGRTVFMTESLDKTVLGQLITRRKGEVVADKF